VIPRYMQIAITLLLAGILVSGIYVIRLTHGEQQKNLLGMENAPAAAPVEGKQEKISILVAYDKDHRLRWQDAAVTIPTDRGLHARAVLHALLDVYVQDPSPHPLAPGADVRDVYFIGNDTAVIDTTRQFADGHPSGILLEDMTLVSMAETLTANVSGITRIKFLVDGKERETLAGHLDLLPFYEVSSLHAAAQEFE